MTADYFVYGDQNVQVPAHINFGKFILDRLRSQSDEVALENGESGDTLTYKELTQNAVNMSTALKGLGVKRGDVVAIGSEKRIEMVSINFAVVFCGATYTPYDLNSGQAILTHKLAISKPNYFISSKLFWNMNSEILKTSNSIKKIISLDEGTEFLISMQTLITNDMDINKFEPAQVEGQIDTACILYSSGTTGMSKGVQLTHLNCILNSLPDAFSDESLHTAFVFGEWYHNYDTFMTYKFIAMGKKIVYLNDVTPKTLLKCIDDCKINIAFLVPSIIIRIVKENETEKHSTDSLKIIYSRAMPLHHKTVELVKNRFPKLEYVLQGYGMTEAGELTSESWGSKGPKPGSVGKASPGITLKVVDLKTRNSLSANQRGELCVRGSVLMKGYIGMDQLSFIDEEGFLKTGDLGYYDEDNYFYINGRLKDIIAYEGHKVCPLELETILQIHPGVHEAGVVGKSEPVCGEVPIAFVVKKPGAALTEKDLIEYVTLQVPPYMQLRGGVKFIDEIPKNPRGKILRQRLQEMLQNQL